jgi:hypothetical protein
VVRVYEHDEWRADHGNCGDALQYSVRTYLSVLTLTNDDSPKSDLRLVLHDASAEIRGCIAKFGVK